MKTKIFVLIGCILFITTLAQAQKMQRGTIAERVSATMKKITAPLKLDASQINRTDSIFDEFYQAQNKIYKDAKASNTHPNSDSFQKILDKRDAQLKLILTPNQYTQFKNKVEDSLRPYWQSHEDN